MGEINKKSCCLERNKNNICLGERMELPFPGEKRKTFVAWGEMKTSVFQEVIKFCYANRFWDRYGYPVHNCRRSNVNIIQK